MELNFNDVPIKYGEILWENATGSTFIFKYCNDEIEMKIIKSYGLYCDVEVCGEIFNNVYKANIKRKRVKYILKRFIDANNDSEFKLSVGDVVLVYGGEFTVNKRIYMDNFTTNGYEVECKKCKTKYVKKEHDILNRKLGCPYCNNKKISKDINSIFTTDKWCLKYFSNIADSYNVTKSSNKRFDYICSCCGRKINNAVFKTVFKNLFACECCRDGVSYPNKFMYSLIKSLNIDYVPEHSIVRSRKRYDIYIPSVNAIIENHGGQHYKDSGFGTFGGRTLEEEQENDKLKRDLALSNGIKHYIELDCRKSEMEWIKNSVMNSELPNLLNFKESDIDWMECERFAVNSNVKLAREMWDGGCDNINDIAKYLDVCDATVLSYINHSSMLKNELNKNIQECCYLWDEGMCIGDIKCKTGLDTSTIQKYLISRNSMLKTKYSVDASIKRGRMKCSNIQKKKILCKEIDLCFLCSDDVVEWFSNHLNIIMCSTSIKKVCRGERKSHKGYTFSYL